MSDDLPSPPNTRVGARRELDLRSGFSMVELMVVVAILGTLAAIGLPTYRKMTEQAKYGATRNQLLGIQVVIMNTRLIERKTLFQMTNSYCMYCVQGFIQGEDITGFTPLWNSSVQSAWSKMGYDTQPYDAWDRAIPMDENELEFGPTDCRHDLVWSAGSDGIFDGGSDSDTGGRGAFGDDLVVSIPYYAQDATHCPNGW